MQLKVIVDSVEGKCSAGYKKGDSFYFNRFMIVSKIPICIHAISAIQNILYGLAHGLDPKDLGFEKEVVLRCPDPGKPYGQGNVTFKVVIE